MFALFRKFVQIYKMQRLILLLLSLFFLSVGCKRELPEGILPEEQMAEVMSEVHILDGYISNMPSDSAKRVIQPLYEQLLGKHGLDSISFTKNVDYYFGNPALTQHTYDRVIKKLEEQERLFLSRDSLTHALTQDSLRRVTRLMQRADLATRRLLNAGEDTTELTIAERTRRLYETSGMERLWENHLLRQPDSLATLQMKEQTDALDEPKPTAEPQEKVEPDTIRPDTSGRHPVKKLEYKPVKRSTR